jgi:hypothetical protein
MINDNQTHPQRLNPRGIAARALLGAAIGVCSYNALRDFLRAALVPREQVQGRVLLNGVGVAAELGLHTQTGPGTYCKVATATAEPDGRFTIAVPQDQLDNDLTVTATWRRRIVHGEDYVPGDNLMPSQFASPQTSPRRFRAREAIRYEALIELSCCNAI